MCKNSKKTLGFFLTMTFKRTKNSSSLIILLSYATRRSSLNSLKEDMIQNAFCYKSSAFPTASLVCFLNLNNLAGTTALSPQALSATGVAIAWKTSVASVPYLSVYEATLRHSISICDFHILGLPVVIITVRSSLLRSFKNTFSII